jgi:hypothetical protein
MRFPVRLAERAQDQPRELVTGKVAGTLVGSLRLDRLGIAVGLEQAQHAVDMREVRPVLVKLAFQPVDAPGDLGALLAERINNMGIGHPDMVGWRLAELNADVVAVATEYRKFAVLAAGM